MKVTTLLPVKLPWQILPAALQRGVFNAHACMCVASTTTTSATEHSYSTAATAATEQIVPPDLPLAPFTGATAHSTKTVN